MADLRVKRPKISTAAGVLALVCALLIALLLTLATTIEIGGGDSLSESAFEDLFYAYVWCGLIFAGGIMVFLRRYRFGGAIVLFFSITLLAYTIAIWYAVVLGVIGGVLGVISKEKISQGILEVVARYGRINIREVAAETGKTEADVELAIIELKSQGQPIRFDAEKREVSYG